MLFGHFFAFHISSSLLMSEIPSDAISFLFRRNFL